MQVKRTTNKVGRVLLLYWIVLVIWQNISRAEARSSIDLVVKISLIVSLTAYYFLRSKSISYNLINIIIFAFFVVLSFWYSGEPLSGSALISYLYPVLLAFLAFGIGNSFEINQEEYVFFLNGVIAVVLYSALYAVVFCTDQIIAAMSFTSAYGNELSSFYISNHEYGMYLAYGIISCLLCLEIGGYNKRKKYYYLCILFFAFNLILTYSRTSLLAMICFSLFFILANNRAKAKKILTGGFLAIALAAIISSRVRYLLLLLIFKEQGGGIGNREELLRLGVKIFQESNFVQKILGNGVATTSIIVENATSHGSLHNAYLQILACFGLVGLGYLICFMFSQVYTCLRMYRHAPFYSALFIALIISAAAMMFTNTAILFTSPIDSYFLTMFVILVPKYARNAILHDRFGCV